MVKTRVSKCNDIDWDDDSGDDELNKDEHDEDEERNKDDLLPRLVLVGEKLVCLSSLSRVGSVKENPLGVEYINTFRNIN